MEASRHILNTSITFLKGVGEKRADLIKKELGIYSYGDLVHAFPFRYVDRTQFLNIREFISQGSAAQFRGKLSEYREEGQGNKKRLIAWLGDETGEVKLIWFRSIRWIKNTLLPGAEYVCYGKASFFKNKAQIAHPELELHRDFIKKASTGLHPVYASTEKLTSRGVDAKVRRKMIENLFEKVNSQHIIDPLPQYLRDNQKLIGKYQALQHIHFPKNQMYLENARHRLKFEELFFIQMEVLLKNKARKALDMGFRFTIVGEYFNKFYKDILPFELTAAQKRVIKEIRHDTGNGYQMNRLLQGDVGSGKTIVALMTMLLAIDNGYQACLMAPTEILAQQHYQTLGGYAKDLGIRIDFLSGSVKGKKRKAVLEALFTGETHILVGTHALIEDPVKFQNLGLAITDEQHRFGVAQRAKLWAKAKNNAPHVLVMTATPIPRTLAMTTFGDLDASVIDELPPGRKTVLTVHKRESQRSQILQFMHEEIKKGRQIYVVYPLIEDSETLDLQNLNDGYERLLEYFPRPDFQMSIVHGRMKPQDKDAEMEKFSKGKTQILVSTTVIEVGVNVPNASVMIIENAERFGLSQLHQLRGRVGRGSEQSYCLLVTGFKVSKDGKRRIQTMCSTNDGFEISRVDLELRGPGNIQGTQQSGTLPLRLADLVEDHRLLEHVRKIAKRILDRDPELKNPLNKGMKDYLDSYGGRVHNWSKIS